MANAAKAVFLDRDGVLNEAPLRDGNPLSPMSVMDVVIPSDVPGALERLRKNGFLLIMVTNQPNIVRGVQSRETVQAINRHVEMLLRLDGVEVCEHDDGDDCECRKPKPGLLLRAAAREGINLGASYMVGDRWRDIEAGRRAGCRTIMIGSGYGAAHKSPPDTAVASLSEAVDWILARPR